MEQHWHKTAWRSPSNIALVKYWGKQGNQLPSNPSLSISLSSCYSEMIMAYAVESDRKQLQLDFLFHGEENDGFKNRIEQFLLSLAEAYPIINKLHIKLNSTNSFPHSSGVASSASAMSALALCFGSMATQQGLWKDEDEMHFFEHCSKIARLASGSASRSLFGNYVQWGFLKNRPDMSDDHAVPLMGVHRNFASMHDAILIVSSKTKKRSSSQGHALMEAHPFAEARYKQARSNLYKLHVALSDGNFDTFTEVTENEALTLHALMMSSSPGYFELLPNSIEIVEKIREFREENHLPVTFTIDAGPNIHLLYPEMIRDQVLAFIIDELEPLCENGRWIDDKIGTGPVKLSVSDISV